MSIKNYIYIFIIVFYSFFINWFSANQGVLPIDTFGFFDTGYGILKGQLPIKDYWAYTGLTVDYFQSFFFLIFGNNWNSYIIHSLYVLPNIHLRNTPCELRSQMTNIFVGQVLFFSFYFH